MHQLLTRIDQTTIDDVEDLHIVMPMYNLREHSSDSEVYGFIQKIKQLILMLILVIIIIVLNLLNISLNY